MFSKKLKIVSWNVNGYRAVLKKGFSEVFKKIDADIFALQEIKIQKSQILQSMKSVPGYTSTFAFSTVKKGYSGVAVYTKLFSKATTASIGSQYFDVEGRVVQIDFNDFIFFSVYFPNGRMSHDRLSYKLDFYKFFFDYVEIYRKEGRSIVIVGDFNTAHNDIDLKHPSPNSKKSGFLPIERDWLTRITKMGYVDTFRFFYPDLVKYSWWSYRARARENNVGWRIDYCFVSQDIIDRGWLEEAFILNDIFGSDHCPIGITLSI